MFQAKAAKKIKAHTFCVQYRVLYHSTVQTDRQTDRYIINTAHALCMPDN